MAFGRECAASILGAARCVRGDDVRLVAARLGIAVRVTGWQWAPVCVDGVVVRGGRRTRAEDQADMAHGLAAWVAYRTGRRLAPGWVSEFVAELTAPRQASGVRAAVVVSSAAGPSFG